MRISDWSSDVCSSDLWIQAHRDQLKPPVGNRCIVDGDFIVMVVGGPNERSDFHYDEGPEFFYQIEGELCLRVQAHGPVRDIPIVAVALFLSAVLLFVYLCFSPFSSRFSPYPYYIISSLFLSFFFSFFF